MPPGGNVEGGTGPTYHKDVEPILQKHCQKCHVENGLAPFALLTYQDARSHAHLVVQETEARRMPPWGAVETEECKPRLPWSHDERLSDAEIATLKAWTDGGTREGDPKDAPAGGGAAASDLPNATDVLKPRSAFTATGSNDQFRCFVLDHDYSQGAYITGIHVVPGNRKVVHHAVVFTDPDGSFAARAGADGSFDCSGAANAMGGGGGMQLGGTESVTLVVWTPGGQPVDLPSDIAMPLTANAKLVMQIHYSPGGETAEPDVTTVQLRTSAKKPKYLLFTSAIGNAVKLETSGDGLQPGDGDPDGTPTFVIPANVRNHVERMQFTMPDPGNVGPIWIYGVLAHEHLAGIDVKVDLEKPGDSQCLLQDKWDFHWQRMYTYAADVEKLPVLATGDKIKVRCTYDNSMQNRRLGAEYEARGLTPMDLHLGEQTTDEMCLAIPQLLVRNP